MFWVLHWILKSSDAFLNAESISECPDRLGNEHLYSTLKRLWSSQCQRPNPSLFNAFVRAYIPAVCRCTAYMCFALGMQLCQMMLIGVFVDWVASDDKEFSFGLLTWVAFAVCTFSANIFSSRGLCMTSLYMIQFKRFTLRLLLEKFAHVDYQTLQHEANLSLILNLFGSDFEFASVVKASLSLPAYLVILCAGGALLWMYLGVAGLIGMGLIFFHLIVVLILIVWFAKLKANSRRIADTRIGFTTQLIEGIGLLKLYAWEVPFLELVKEARSAECVQLKKLALIRVALRSLMAGLIALNIFIPVLVHIEVYGSISVSNTFVGVSILHLCNTIVFFYVSIGLQHLVTAQTTCKRAERMLLMEEALQYEVQLDQPALKLTAANFGWNEHADEEPWKGSSNLLLHELNLEVRPGELLVVTGPVASGKSSFLLALLQELPLQSGTYKRQGSLAYSGDTPWIISMTIKENIIFGRDFNAELYALALRLSMLQDDLAVFPSGDQTVVGDRGITLSGGQKARLNLARAIYADSDFLLLDDPLSAVDSEVGKHIISGLVELVRMGKGVVLATHHTSTLQYADKIVILDRGNQWFYGDYDGLNSREDLGLLLDQVSKSISQPNKEIMTESGTIVDNEELCVSRPYSLYYAYLKLGFLNSVFLVLIILLFIVSQAAAIFVYYWAGQWISAEDRTNYSEYSFAFLAVYYVLVTVRFFVIYFTIAVANQKLLNLSIRGLAHTFMVFFDKNPTGRILNRFTKDISIIDSDLHTFLSDAINTTVYFVGCLFAVTAVLPIGLVGLSCCGVLMFFVFKRIVPVATRLKALEVATKSPLLSTVNSLLGGILTARSMNLHHALADKAIMEVQTNSAVETMFVFVQMYIELLSEIGASIALIIASAYIIIGTEELDPAMTGASLGLLVSLTGISAYGTNSIVRSHNCMTSTQRLFEYSQLPSEGELHSNYPFKITHGNIEFQKVYMAYQPHLPYALKGLTFSIPGGSKVGIIGRTGAGKSSILQVLFRLTNPSSGCILIDNQDISAVGLHQLRGQISVIPQNPLIFKTTIRNNLDPLDRSTETRLLEVMERVGLNEFLQQQPKLLDSVISFDEASLSAGQKQLVCLARALLRNSKIVLMDEPTSSVDHNTDEFIQSTVKEAFRESTVLTIAHRLRTVVVADLIIVMADGKCQEFGSPKELVQLENSLFSNYIEHSGPEEAAYLRSCIN